MSELDNRLKRLYEERDRIDKQILKTRKQLLPVKLRRLLKNRRECYPGETCNFTGFLKSAIETPDKVSVVGIYPFDKLLKFCYENDIPFHYKNVGDEFSGDSYTDFRVGFTDE